MGKHHNEQQTVVTQKDVAGAIASGLAAGPTPPQPPELLAVEALLGKPVRAMVGGEGEGAHVDTVFLTDFHQGAYCGVAIRSFKMGSEATPVIKAVTGLKQYTPGDRSAYQFVLPGEDTSVLLNINHDILVATHQPTEVVEESNG